MNTPITVGISKKTYFEVKYKDILHLQMGVVGFQISDCSTGNLRNVNVKVNVISRDQQGTLGAGNGCH